MTDHGNELLQLIHREKRHQVATHRKMTSNIPWRHTVILNQPQELALSSKSPLLKSYYRQDVSKKHAARNAARGWCHFPLSDKEGSRKLELSEAFARNFSEEASLHCPGS